MLRAEREVNKARARDERTLRRDLELRFEDRLRLDPRGRPWPSRGRSWRRPRPPWPRPELALERMVGAGPAAGVVLERLTMPRMVLDASGPSHVVCSLYDPASLRVRVDVPQSEVEQLFVGQRAEILTQAKGRTAYAGEVLRIVQRADIQKVTLEVQVRVEDGDAWIRPDMLAQVRFLLLGRGRAPWRRRRRRSASPGLVEGGAVWLLDPARGVARRREVEANEPVDGWVVSWRPRPLQQGARSRRGAPRGGHRRARGRGGVQ